MSTDPSLVGGIAFQINFYARIWVKQLLALCTVLGCANRLLWGGRALFRLPLTRCPKRTAQMRPERSCGYRLISCPAAPPFWPHLIACPWQRLQTRAQRWWG